MRIAVHTYAEDTDAGTNAQAFATEREQEDAFLEGIGSSREAFDDWLKNNPDEDMFDFKEDENLGGWLDTFNVESFTVDFDLCAQPLPTTGSEQVAEAIECLKRARDLLKVANNRKTLARIRAALSSAKGAARIQEGREQRELEFRRETGAEARRECLARSCNPISVRPEFAERRAAWDRGWNEEDDRLNAEADEFEAAGETAQAAELRYCGEKAHA